MFFESEGRQASTSACFGIPVCDKMRLIIKVAR
jgi:hypothetical protein